MTLAVTLTYGATTVTLNSSASGCELLHNKYAPIAADADQDEVTETIELVLSGANIAAVQSVARTINVALHNAREWSSHRSGAPVYINLTPTGVTAYRSEVLDGRLVFDPTALTWLELNRHAKAQLIITRRNYWEGPEVAVTTTNGNGTGGTIGLPIYNCADGSGTAPALYQNHLDIAGTIIAGDLPGATRLEITNLDGTYRIYDAWIGHNWTDPANAVQLYEAEDGVSESGTAVAGNSGGEQVNKSLSSGSEQTLISWDISSAALSAAKGQWVHALIRFAQSTWETNTLFRLKLTWNSSTFWQSNQVQPDSTRALLIRDLFQLRLPPGITGLSALDGMRLVLTGEQSSGASKDLKFDFLALVPADGWRYLTHNGYGTAQNARIVDDGIDGYLYRDNGSGAERAAILTGYGEPIKLQPGKDQRLYFWLHSHSTNAAPISMSASIKIYYRPRRLTL